MNGQIKEEKVYRFTDYQVIDRDKDKVYWNIENIKEIITLAIIEYITERIGIVTWSYDFSLIANYAERTLFTLLMKKDYDVLNTKTRIDRLSIMEIN